MAKRNRKLVSYPKDLRKKAEKKGEALFAVAIDTTTSKPLIGKGDRDEQMGTLTGPLACLLFMLAHEFQKKYNQTVHGWLKGFGEPGGPYLVYHNERARIGIVRNHETDAEFIDVEWMDGTKSKFPDTSLHPHKKLPAYTVSGDEVWVPDPNLNLSGTVTGRVSSEKPSMADRPTFAEIGKLMKAVRNASKALTELDPEAHEHDAVLLDEAMAIVNSANYQAIEGPHRMESDKPSVQNVAKSPLDRAKALLDSFDTVQHFQLIQAASQHWIDEEGGGEERVVVILQKIKRLAELGLASPDDAVPPKGPTHKSYLITVTGGTEPELLGPYDSPEERDEEAKRQWSEELSQETDAVFGLDVSLKSGNDPTLFSYSNAFMEGDDDEESGEADNWDRATCVAYVSEHELASDDEVVQMDLDRLRAVCNEHQALQGNDGT